QYARLATVIKNARKEAKGPVLLLDGGDFFGGTLYHLIAPRGDTTFNPEIDFFKMIGLDYTIFGNHEFDAREEGLATMLSKANQTSVSFK
ncbi:MAG: metallophosphoesterase, partial [Bdellovibrionota bacterium]